MASATGTHRRTFLAAVLSAAFGKLLPALNTAEPAPRFFAKTLDGERFDNQSLKGRVVLLQFWTTWCPVCKSDQAAVETIVREYAPKGLVVLAVDVNESKKRVKKYLEESPRSPKIVLTEDTNLAAIFEVKSFPRYIVINREGNLSGEQNGAGGDQSLRRLLAKAGLRDE
jgi:thiol-disulfide isomerase/thioredoxin